MQRNNIATRFPRERKAQLVRWREVDGLMPGEIAARAARQWPELPAIHTRTWHAWSRGPEYRELRNLVCEYERDLADDRALAAVLNDGRGPEALADLVVMDVVRALREQTRAGQVTDLRDLASVTQALSPILRRQVQEAKLDADRRLEEARRKHRAEIDEWAQRHAYETETRDQRIAELEAELARLRAGGAVDLKKVADDMERVLGG